MSSTACVGISGDHWCSCVRGVYLHESDEQEEGVGSAPDLLIEEPGQEGEDSILGGTAEEKKKKTLYDLFIMRRREPGNALAKV